MIAVDVTSLLVEVEAEVALAEVEAELSKQRLSLDVEDLARRGPMRVGAWLARGAPGSRAPWRDPADHLVAGLSATLPDGRVLLVRPGPRRAVGPDLVALFFGTGERFGRITRAWLRVHPLLDGRVHRPSAPPFVHAPPAVTPDEERLLAAIAEALREA
jgi:alkyldihydroxyacetonephosphate synthase